MRSASRLLGAQPTPLADRTYELGTKRHCLTVDGARQLTLIGPVEVGKTRFALATGDANVTDHVWEVPRWYRVGKTELARALGISDVGSRRPLRRVGAYLGEQELLLVLDTFEQVMSTAGGLADLLSRCPRLALLVTSRVPLQRR